MLRASLDAIILLESELVLLASDQAIRQLGATCEADLIGCHVLRFIGEEYGPVARVAIKDLISNGEILIPTEVRLVGLDDKQIDVELSGSSISYGERKIIQVVFRNVGSRIKMRQKLVNSEYRYRNIFDFFPDATVIVREGKVIYANAMASRLYSATDHPLDLVGHPTADLIHPDYVNITKQKVAQMMRNEGGIEFFESVHMRDDGSPIYVELGGRTIPMARGTGLLVVVRDISDRLKIQEAALAARIEAEEANTAKSDFLANMSHELRTPLNAVIGFSQFLLSGLRGPLTEDQAGYVEDIQKSGELLLDVIGDILDISKIEAGKMMTRVEFVSFPEVMENVAQLLTHSLLAQTVTFENQLDELASHIYVDKRMLKQIMLNLLSNAIKFNKPDGRIVVTTRKNALNSMQIEIQDTGIGMHEEEIIVAMEPFGQVANAMTRDHEGTGLGLPLVRSMVELNDGQIEIESTPGTGTCVTITLPTVPPQFD